MKNYPKCMALAIATVILVSGCNAASGIEPSATTSMGVMLDGNEYEIENTPTPIPYEQSSYYDAFPGITNVVFNAPFVQDIGGQEMPLYQNGAEITVSFETDMTSADLLFDVVPMPYDNSVEPIYPLSEPLTISCVDGKYEASFTDCNECFLGYYMSFTDAQTGVLYFDAIVACGDATVMNVETE